MTTDDLIISPKAGLSTLSSVPDVAPPNVDIDKLRQDRLDRVQLMLREKGWSGCLLVDPVNIHYACGARNMKPFTMRNPARYLLTLTDGPTYLFEFHRSSHLADGVKTITEVFPAITCTFTAAGTRLQEKTEKWADQIDYYVRKHCGDRGNILFGLERVNSAAARALEKKGFILEDSQDVIERARCIKTPEELKCAQKSLDAAAVAVEKLRAALKPGMTENELWSIIHKSVIEQDGEYIETRLLQSGPRTNPYMQECSNRIIEDGDMVCLDTDIVGVHGYYADFSRSFLCGDKPDDYQKFLYQTAHEQLHHNMSMIKPGMTFRELAERAWKIPDRFLYNRYVMLVHGVGMCGEYPYIYHLQDIPDYGYDGIIEPNMTLCVEVYIGDQGGNQGVKLEQQILVTEDGTKLMSHFPFEDDFLK